MAEKTLPLEDDEAVGYCLFFRDGTPCTPTVALSERGAMVNALVTIWGIPVTSLWTDAQIKAEATSHVIANGMRFGPCYIGPLEIVPDDPAKGS